MKKDGNYLNDKSIHQKKEKNVQTSVALILKCKYCLNIKKNLDAMIHNWSPIAAKRFKLVRHYENFPMQIDF